MKLLTVIACLVLSLSCKSTKSAKTAEISFDNVQAIEVVSRDPGRVDPYSGLFISDVTGKYIRKLRFVEAPNGWTCVGGNRTTPQNLPKLVSANKYGVVISGISVAGDAIEYSCHAY